MRFVPALILLLAGEQAKEAAGNIRVVKTWKELLDVEPISIGDGVKVRLGIENLECPSPGGVLLHCLAEGFAPAEEWGRGDLGPLCVDVMGPQWPTFTTRGSGLEGSHRESFPADAKLLFSRCVMVARESEYSISVSRNWDEKPIGQCVVRGVKAPHPWTPLAVDPQEFKVQVLDLRPAIPIWSERRPIVYDGVADRKLPELLPSAPSNEIQILVNEQVLLLSSTKPFPPGHTDCFLARWWVNDRPFVPQPLKECGSNEIIRLTGEEKEIRKFRFQLDLTRFNKGDRVGLQLLYCPKGWETVRDDDSRLDMDRSKDSRAVLSNRVERLR